MAKRKIKPPKKRILKKKGFKKGSSKKGVQNKEFKKETH
ncbi:hypothetical protein HPHPA11_0793 [Helicobacter pylori Hp A-11]|uniref:Uncharacterized protein n=1 Tax=Helicobacter pylori Hp A-11 TaxID=992035 RepID=N4TPS0_HELPX|nr:hypothetical protein HPHPA11_0793 [Helicobacter pylori Hp A-11]